MPRSLPGKQSKSRPNLGYQPVKGETLGLSRQHSRVMDQQPPPESKEGARALRVCMKWDPAALLPECLGWGLTAPCGDGLCGMTAGF